MPIPVLVFCLAAGVLAYLMAGYPILLAYFRWRRRPPVRKDLLTPGDWFLKRVTSPFRTLLVMQVASLCSCSVFFVPAQWLWKQTRVREPG